MKYKSKPEYVEAYQYHEGEEPQWLKDLVESKDILEHKGKYYILSGICNGAIRDTDYVVGVKNKFYGKIWTVMDDKYFNKTFEPVIEKSKNEPVEGQTTLEDFGV